MEQALITLLNLRKPEKNVVISNVVLTSSRRVYLKSAIKLLVNVLTWTLSFKKLSEMKADLKVSICLTVPSTKL